MHLLVFNLDKVLKNLFSWQHLIVISCLMDQISMQNRHLSNTGRGHGVPVDCKWNSPGVCSKGPSLSRGHYEGCSHSKPDHLLYSCKFKMRKAHCHASTGLTHLEVCRLNVLFLAFSQSIEHNRLSCYVCILQVGKYRIGVLWCL